MNYPKSSKVKWFKRAAATCLAGLFLALSVPIQAFAADASITITARQYAAITNCVGTNYTHASGIFHAGSGTYYCVEPDKNTPTSNTQYTLVGKNEAGFSGVPISMNWMFRCIKEGNEIAQSSEYNGLTEDMKAFAVHAATTAEGNSSMLKAHTAVGGNGGNSKFTWLTKEQTALFIRLAQATFNKAKTSSLTPTDNDAIFVYKTSNSNTQKICVLEHPLIWEEQGAIEVYKTDENGAGLAGAEFAIYKNNQFYLTLGPTNVNGYACTDKVLDLGTYRVVETRFPENYTDNGTTSWTVTVNSSTVPARVGGNAGVVNVLKKGGIAIRKADEAGNTLSGVKFGVFTDYGCTNRIAEIETDGNGIAYYGVSNGSYTLRHGDTYYFKETAPKSSAYIPVDTVYPVTVVHSTITYGNGNSEVINNVKRGSLEVIKTSEDNMVAGIQFRLTGTSDVGEPVDMTATTDASGKAVFENVLVGSNYTIEEVNTLQKYVVPSVLNTTIQWNNRSSASFRNVLKKWNLRVTKRDTEMGAAQGDATLAGAVYGIYENGVLRDTYTTDANGSFSTKTYICGDNWTLKEITPSNGYLLDETEYPIGASAGEFTVENNSLELTVREKVKMGRIAITKHTEDGFSNNEIPEAGAKFEVFLKSAGSYANAKETERDIIEADDRGLATTKDLPYGRYTVKQIYSWEGRELKEPFDVTIQDNDQEYYFIVNNPIFKSLVRIVKKDTESGSVIPLAGAGFKVYKQDGTLITQTVVYPAPATIDTFYTNEQGYLIMPQPLPYGKYYVVETQAPEGYVLNNGKVYFEVSKNHLTEAAGNTFVEVSVYNTAQKGRITVEKRGEVFVGVTRTDADPVLIIPVFAERALAGATFTVTAKRDVVTPDGTLRAHAGEIVATITTDASGVATTAPLYLGIYEIREITAPAGYVLNTVVDEVELRYADQTVAVQTKNVTKTNDRQKVFVRFVKAMEADTRYNIEEAYREVRFGLYANEDIVGVDGAVLPKDSLIAIAGIDKNGNGQFEADVPFGKYYVQEIQTNAYFTTDLTKYALTASPESSDKGIVNITVNNGEAIQNRLRKGALRIIKTFEGTQIPMQGIPFRITNEALGFDQTYYTNENGQIVLEDLIATNYTVRELECDKNIKFVLITDTEVAVPEDEEITVTMNNKYKRGALKVIKTFEGKTTVLKGVPFRITCDELDYDETVETDENGEILLENLVVGTYVVQELGCDATEQFVLSDATEVEVSADRISELTLRNLYKRGSIKIIKHFEGQDKPVKGVPFRITNDEFGFDKVYYTDENGMILVDGLIIGTYKITEESCDANKDYILAAASEVQVAENETVEVSVDNRKSPKTGDTTSYPAMVGLVVASAATCGLVVSRKKKRA